MRIELNQGKVLLIDREDWERLKRHGWYAVKMCGGKWRVVATVIGTGGNKKMNLARKILDAPPGTQVDHIDGDTLDNRRCNLRISTPAQNQQNTRARGGSSKYKGVSWFTRRGRWRVAFNWLGKTHFVGYFDDEVEAARTYDKHILELAGEWAVLNFPGAVRNLSANPSQKKETR